MTCDDVRPRLTAYLDGDLDADRGTAVRGHLRTCDACREIAEREAVLRDGLRDLPTVDPPPALWANIQAQLAAAEVEHSKRPAWRRALARWAPVVATPRFAVGGVLAMAAAGILWWKTHPSSDPEPPVKIVDVKSPTIQPSHQVMPAMPIASPCQLDAPAGTDIADDLAGEAARVTACYAQTEAELAQLATEARGAWTDEQRAEFDTHVATLKAAVAAAGDERARQRAYRKLNHYLQTAVTRDQVVLASGGL